MSLFKSIFFRFALYGFICAELCFATVAHATYQDEPGAKLRWLDKVTARTGVVELRNDESAKYGDLVIRVKACRTQDPLEGADSAAFVQVWENKTGTDPEWVYSGWMFSSSPAVAAMDHPVYDVWVLGCIGRPEAPAQATQAVPEALPSAGDTTTDDGATATSEEGKKGIDEIVDENASAEPASDISAEDSVPVDEEATPREDPAGESVDTSPAAEENAAPVTSEPDYDAPYNGYKHLQ